MGIFSKIFGGQDALQTDARRVYSDLLAQSRMPEFYTLAGYEDNYDGRVEVLTLHMAALFFALRRFDDQGAKLSQAVFDEMKDDFEIALREEGLSDGGVKNRIKPIVAHFYTQVKCYTDVLDGDATAKDWPTPAARDYFTALNLAMVDKTLGQIAMVDLDFPPITKNS